MSKQTPKLTKLRDKIRRRTLADEGTVLRELIQSCGISEDDRREISSQAEDLVDQIRNHSDPGLMETFLEEYGLSTDEGVALMCLAEALLRVPDAETIDALIEDKIAPSDWSKHLGQSSSPLVNASTWALLLTGKVLSDDDIGMLSNLRTAVKRLGEPVIRTAVSQAMKEMGHQFVLGRDIREAMRRAKENEKRGYTYSYDMLGEAARTDEDARRYHLSYSHAISALAPACTSEDIRENPGISVKLSALHPRYEFQKRERVLEELVPRCRSLALLAKSANMGFNIDAEEADRLDISLDVIEAVLSDPGLRDWNGFGVVVQAYGQRAGPVIDYLYELAKSLDRKLMVRLVKGAYWDTEIKRAQTLGLDGFPVFTRKASTDVSYIANAARLLELTDRIYPQFATHNAHTVSAILALAKDKSSFEFQRLHGMGESLHDLVLKREDTRCRIYAPVGAHQDLLAYLVRRLLENGANSSFVNQIVNEEIPPAEVASDPFTEVEEFLPAAANPGIRAPATLYGEARRNSKGWDINDPVDVAWIEQQRAPWISANWKAKPLLAGDITGGNAIKVVNPANPKDQVGEVIEASEADVEVALSAATPWDAVSAAKRAKVLNKAADLYELHAGELFTIAAREAGKTLLDCINELREAVDFLRYYANEGIALESEKPLGVVSCVSPWNFPLAIFTGQISAALTAGNAVLAKPAESTALIAHRAVELLHEAGVPKPALQLLPGKGSVVGSRITGDPRIGGVCFTGSTATAQRIHKAIAEHVAPSAPLVAETGGLNAMIVDSTALPEQAVRDIIASAFQSAGQRCSALRVLYVQKDVYKPMLTMLTGAMDELALGNPLELSTDIGPVIDAPAKKKIAGHIERARQDGRLIKQLDAPQNGTFIGPALIEVNSITDLEEEIFGPVLHVATYAAEDLEKVIGEINSTGYGLTFGLHTRIDDRVQHIVESVEAGNLYVNRNQIGAIVGSQPFGGEGLSGTGPKAGGPNYVRQFKQVPPGKHSVPGKQSSPVDVKTLQTLIDQVRNRFRPAIIETQNLPGPTGESNQYSVLPRGIVLCLGPDKENCMQQVKEAKAYGCVGVSIADTEGVGALNPKALTGLTGIDAVSYWGEEERACELRRALAARHGPILPLITGPGARNPYIIERHVCVDTTASGGNAALLAAQG